MRNIVINMQLLKNWDYMLEDMHLLFENLIECDFEDTLYVDIIPDKLRGNYVKINLELSDYWEGLNEFEIYQCLKKGKYEGVKIVSTEIYINRNYDTRRTNKTILC